MMFHTWQTDKFRSKHGCEWCPTPTSMGVLWKDDQTGEYVCAECAEPYRAQKALAQ